MVKLKLSTIRDIKKDLMQIFENYDISLRKENRRYNFYSYDSIDLTHIEIADRWNLISQMIYIGITCARKTAREDLQNDLRKLLGIEQ
jgi:hypothetical protein